MLLYLHCYLCLLSLSPLVQSFSWSYIRSTSTAISTTISTTSSTTHSLSLMLSQSSTENNHSYSHNHSSISNSHNNILIATDTLTQYDQRQQEYIKQHNDLSIGGGTVAYTFLQTQITSSDREIMKESIRTLIQEAHRQRAKDVRHGRIKLGICAENVQEGLMGLKSWVSALELPRGWLHGMDVDGVPIPPEELGSVYIKYNTGGCMTFTDMRRMKMGFDALWRPGDCVLERYDGDVRGIYLNVELDDLVFRQFGVFPTDLFMEPEEEDEDW